MLLRVLLWDGLAKLWAVLEFLVWLVIGLYDQVWIWNSLKRKELEMEIKSELKDASSWKLIHDTDETESERIAKRAFRYRAREWKSSDFWPALWVTEYMISSLSKLKPTLK